ncbi:MAG TPA: HAD family phosphatase [Anaerolineales bacterium]|nr:HAD family phosphatase [Anaerolineales bacterium]
MIANDLGAVIFDMDGVIVDSEPIYFASNQRLFARLGFDVRGDDYAQFVGLSADRMWATLKERHRLPHPISDLVQMEADGMLAGLLAAELHPMPGLLDLLDRLQAQGCKIALASSSARRVITAVLENLGLAGRFEPAVSGEDVPHGKPAPDIFLLTARLLGVPPAGCLVIEDSASGVRAAKTAGMRCTALRSPNSGPQDLSPADAIIDSLAQVITPW